jgi:hypothetical protein
LNETYSHTSHVIEVLLASTRSFNPHPDRIKTHLGDMPPAIAIEVLTIPREIET